VSWRPWLEDRALRQMQGLPSEAFAARLTDADPAGLAAAAELSPVAIPDVVPGQTDSAGGSWRGRYDRLWLNT
jgi:hypothetical protein